MTKEEFDIIISSLDARINKCKYYLENIKSTEDLKKLTIEEAIQLKEFCTQECDDMTKIAMVELYHIIGMGKLTAPQMTKFAFKMQEYLTYRPDIKNIAGNFNLISSLPGIPTKTKFQLETLCNILLTTGYGEHEVIELSTIADYHETKQKEHINIKSASNIYRMDQFNIYVKHDRVREFYSILSSTLVQSLKLDKFLDSVYKNGSYCGISWLRLGGDEYVGVVTIQNYADKLRKNL